MDPHACPICFGLLVDPYIVVCCGHSFCGHCLRASLAEKDHCPMCRQEKPQFTPNRALSEVIDVSPKVRQEMELLAPPGAAVRTRAEGYAFWVRVSGRTKAVMGPCLRCFWVYEARWRCFFYVALLFCVVVYLRVQEVTYVRNNEMAVRLRGASPDFRVVQP